MARSTGWSGPGRPRRPHKLQVQPLLQGQQDHWLEAVARPEALSPWSHDIDKELTGVPHGLLEGLAAACQLWGDSGQLPDRRPPRRPAHHRVYTLSTCTPLALPLTGTHTSTWMLEQMLSEPTHLSSTPTYSFLSQAAALCPGLSLVAGTCTPRPKCQRTHALEAAF